MDAATHARMRAEADRLNRVSDELLSVNLQGDDREDHIALAEGLLAYYEQSVKLQLELVSGMDDAEIKGEGTLKFYRLAAELHVKIAEAKR